MKKFLLTAAGITVVFGVWAIIIALIDAVRQIGVAGSIVDTDIYVYFFVIIPTVYCIYLFLKLLKEKDFYVNHKIASLIFIWGFIVTVVVAVLYIVLAFATGEGLGIWIAMLALIFGTFISSTLSLIAYLVELFVKKNKRVA